MHKNLSSKNPNQVARTLVQTADGFVVVSTIKRSPELKGLDGFLDFAGSIALTEEEKDERPYTRAGDGDYETGVFACNSEGEISSWSELAMRRYSTKTEAQLGHNEIVKGWEA